jgi:hypothetical protein
VNWDISSYVVGTPVGLNKEKGAGSIYWATIGSRWLPRHFKALNIQDVSKNNFTTVFRMLLFKGLNGR